MARSCPTWIHRLRSSGSSNQYSNHGEKTAKCWRITALPNWTLAGQCSGKKGRYEAHLCSQGWSGLSWGDAERAFSAWVDDSRDELFRLNYKDTQHIDKNLFDVICKHFLIISTSRLLGLGDHFIPTVKMKNLTWGRSSPNPPRGRLKPRASWFLTEREW